MLVAIKCGAIFRYLSLPSVQDLVIFVNKHLIKVDLPHYPVAAAERSRCVLVGANETFEVGDHDFMKFPASQL